MYGRNRGQSAKSYIFELLLPGACGMSPNLKRTETKRFRSFAPGPLPRCGLTIKPTRPHLQCMMGCNDHRYLLSIKRPTYEIFNSALKI
jgi:hypothetical protein